MAARRLDPGVRTSVAYTYWMHGDYENDRDWRRRVQAWLGDIWHEKDELIQQMLDTREFND